MGGLAIATTEWALLWITSPDAFVGFGEVLGLWPVIIGNLLPCAVIAAAALGLVVRGGRWLEGRGRRRELAAIAAGLLSAPYAAWLARFTFSGARASSYKYHAVYVGVTAVAVIVTFAAVAWWIGFRDGRRAAAPAVVGVGVGVTVAASTVNATFLQNEYEPLHAFLAGAGTLFAVIAGIEASRRWAAPTRARLVAAGAFAIVAWSAVSALVLAGSEQRAWVVWGRTANSRYITKRVVLGPLSPKPSRPVERSAIVVKPNLDTDLTRAWRQRRAEEPLPHIVLFGVDGLRPDHMGTYGYRRHQTTPHIDAMAKRGVVFTNAFTSYPATATFNTSLLVGRTVPYVKQHRTPSPYQQLAITRLLHQKGYYSIVSSWFESSGSAEFDPADYEIEGLVPRATLEQIKSAKVMPFVPVETDLEHVARHLRAVRQRKAPMLLWMHLLGTHLLPNGEFYPSPDHPFGDSRSDRYDSAVAGTERWIATVERMVAELDDGRPIVWFIFADHGSRLDHGGRDLYRGLIHVPLIVVGPKFRPAKVDHPVDVSLDLAATVLDLAGMTPPDEYDGVSLIPSLMGLPTDEAMNARLIPLVRGAWRGAIHGSFKLIEHRDTRSLFDLKQDPLEKRNIIGQHPELAAQLAAVMSSEIDRRYEDYRRAKRESRAAR